MDENDVGNNATGAAAGGLAQKSATRTPTVSADVYLNQIIIATVVGLLSAIGSAYIIFSLVRYRRNELGRTFNRLLLCLCVSDFISSVAFVLGSWYVCFIIKAGTQGRSVLFFFNEKCILIVIFVALSRSIPAIPPVGFEAVVRTPGLWNHMFPYAVGNTGTCTAQGFFVYLGTLAKYTVYWQHRSFVPPSNHIPIPSKSNAPC